LTNREKKIGYWIWMW